MRALARLQAFNDWAATPDVARPAPGAMDVYHWRQAKALYFQPKVTSDNPMLCQLGPVDRSRLPEVFFHAETKALSTFQTRIAWILSATLESA
jgi:hypothetical protein